MDEAIFERYEVACEQGNKRLARSLITEFTNGFTSLEERETWTRWYFDNRTIGHTVRHELFEHVIFPVLLAGYQRSDPWCIQILERCAQTLYKANHLWAQVDHKSDFQLAADLLEIAPTDLYAKRRMLEHLINWFKYVEHEWPSGILYGKDGATSGQCEEIFRSIQQAKTLDAEGQHSKYLTEFEGKVSQYVDRHVKSPSRTSRV